MRQSLHRTGNSVNSGKSVHIQNSRAPRKLRCHRLFLPRPGRVLVGFYQIWGGDGRVGCGFDQRTVTRGLAELAPPASKACESPEPLRRFYFGDLFRSGGCLWACLGGRVQPRAHRALLALAIWSARLHRASRPPSTQLTPRAARVHETSRLSSVASHYAGGWRVLGLIKGVITHPCRACGAEAGETVSHLIDCLALRSAFAQLFRGSPPSVSVPSFARLFRLDFESGQQGGLLEVRHACVVADAFEHGHHVLRHWLSSGAGFDIMQTGIR